MDVSQKSPDVNKLDEELFFFTTFISVLNFRKSNEHLSLALTVQKILV